MSETVVIGLSANANGAHTQELLDGYQFACNWIGENTAYVWADDGRDPKLAAAAATSLADAEVHIVVGHLSAAASLAAVEVYRHRNVALIAPATSHPELNPTGYGGVLRVFGLDGLLAKSMIRSVPHGGAPIILFQDQVYGLSLARELEAALTQEGAPVARFDMVDPAWLDAAAKWQDTVYIAGIHEACAEAVCKLRAISPQCRISLGDDCYTPNFMALCGADAEGCFVSTPVVPMTAAPVKCLEKQHPVFDGYFSTCTISASIALQAVQLAPELKGEELGIFVKSRTWNTPFGQMTFDKQGNLRGVLYRTYTIRHGKFLHVPDS